MIIVKLGGSLYSNALLKTWVDGLASIKKQQIIIVPGGGPFANQVRVACRDWNINDQFGHEMALLGMQQFAYLIASLNENIQTLDTLDSLDSQLSNFKCNTLVWMPFNDVNKKCAYPKNWQVTSDSIALWLASQLSAKVLYLIKSAEINNQTLEQLIASDIVDDYFPVVRKCFDGEVEIYHANAFNQFVHEVNNE